MGEEISLNSKSYANEALNNLNSCLTAKPFMPINSNSSGTYYISNPLSNWGYTTTTGDCYPYIDPSKTAKLNMNLKNIRIFNETFINEGFHTLMGFLTNNVKESKTNIEEVDTKADSISVISNNLIFFFRLKDANSRKLSINCRLIDTNTSRISEDCELVLLNKYDESQTKLYQNVDDSIAFSMCWESLTNVIDEYKQEIAEHVNKTTAES